MSNVRNGDLDSFLMSCAHLYSQNGSMAYDSMFVQCSIDISCVNGFVELVCGDLVFVDKCFITVDAFSSTVKDCVGIDLSPVVHDSNSDAYRRCAYILNHIWCYMWRRRRSDISDRARITMGQYNSFGQCGRGVI